MVSEAAKSAALWVLNACLVAALCYHRDLMLWVAATCPDTARAILPADILREAFPEPDPEPEPAPLPDPTAFEAFVTSAFPAAVSDVLVDPVVQEYAIVCAAGAATCVTAVAVALAVSNYIWVQGRPARAEERFSVPVAPTADSRVPQQQPPSPVAQVEGGAVPKGQGALDRGPYVDSTRRSSLGQPRFQVQAQPQAHIAPSRLNGTTAPAPPAGQEAPPPQVRRDLAAALASDTPFAAPRPSQDAVCQPSPEVPLPSALGTESAAKAGLQRTSESSAASAAVALHQEAVQEESTSTQSRSQSGPSSPVREDEGSRPFLAASGSSGAASTPLDPRRRLSSTSGAAVWHSVNSATSASRSQPIRALVGEMLSELQERSPQRTAAAMTQR